jgi:hypothetical protein
MANGHTKDSDCTIDPETGLCVTCCVERGDACQECGGRSFHLEGCPDSDATSFAEMRTRIGNTPSCEDCGEQHDPEWACEEVAQMLEFANANG